MAPDTLDQIIDDIPRRPVRRTAADLMDETGEDTGPLRRMGDLRVELHPVIAALVVTDAGDGAALGAGNELEPRGQAGDPVTVAHPDVQQPPALGTGVVLDVAQQARVAASAHPRIAELLVIGGFHPAAQLARHGLHAVADAEYRHAGLEDGLGDPRAVVHRHGLRPAGEDKTGRTEIADRRLRGVPGVDLAVYPRLAHTAGDQLSVLGAEIENEDAMGVNILSH